MRSPKRAETIMKQEISAAGDAKGARVIATVSSIPLAVDLGRYDLAEVAFAQLVTIDGYHAKATARVDARHWLGDEL